MIETKLVNIHHKLPYQIPIGRESKWGNPFSHMEGTTAKFHVESREEAIAAYRKWIVTRKLLLKSLHELWGMTLGCYCKPADCHGDVLIELVNEKFQGWKPPFRVIVAGGRDFKDYAQMCRVLNKALKEKKETHTIIIVSGAAKGADRLGEKYAREHGYLIHKFPANWDKFGKGAGLVRNTDMSKVANAAVCFWDNVSTGTEDMIKKATKQELPLRVVNY